MDDLISRQAAISLPVKPKEDRYFQTQNLDDAYDYGWYSLQKCIEKLPPAPERKRGKWIVNGDIPKECPFCGEDWDKYVFGEIWYTSELPNFCPNCGADMREGQDG